MEELKQANFNSIKVQLKQERVLHGKNRFEFQFHKGTIKTGRTLARLSASAYNFNSIKVQLKHKNRMEYQVYRNLFQFHKGTINNSSLIIQ